MNAALFIKILVLSFTSLLSHANSHQHQAPHVHGISDLKLMVDNGNIRILFKSPANNIVGFEHSAISPEEKQLLNKAKLIFSRPEILFNFHDTHCRPAPNSIKLNGFTDKHDHQNLSTHTEISAQYHFVCNPEIKLSYISINFFSHFKNIHKINAQWVSATEQGGAALTSDNNQLIIK